MIAKLTICSILINKNSINVGIYNQNSHQKISKSPLILMDVIIQDYKDIQSDHIQEIVYLRNKQYKVIDIDQTSNYFNASSISRNEKYLAYGGTKMILYVYDIKQQKVTKEINAQNQIIVCQFTQDSQFLYLGLYDGCVCGYSVANDYQEVFNLQIHNPYYVCNLITIKNNYLITSGDKTIIKTDVNRKQEVFKINTHTGFIVGMDYNYKDDIILSGSDDRSIKLWNCSDQCLIINKQQAHQKGIKQIQFVNNNPNIISLSKDGIVYKWIIDLKQKDLIKIQQYSDESKIFNFYQVNQDQNLLLICDNHVKILNKQNEIIIEIQHNSQSNYYIKLQFILYLTIIDNIRLDCRQLDYPRYIQIKTDHQISLAILKK